MRAISDRCPRCAAAFRCEIATGRCWCATIDVRADDLARLAAEHDGCLCPTCLRELARPPLASGS